MPTAHRQPIRVLVVDDEEPVRDAYRQILCPVAPTTQSAARDELRKGASQIKIMVSGGVTSPLDRIDSNQFSLEEIRAAVEEAEAQDRYVMAHAYTARAIDRALECGVRSIEHGNLIDEATATKLRAKNAFLVPTIVVYWAMAKEGRAQGLSDVQQAKVAVVHEGAMRGLEIAAGTGVKMAFGSDLFGPMLRHQSAEFSIRAEILKPIDVIRAATSTAAELFNMTGEIGAIVPGARADILVVDGDPTRDLTLLQEQGRHFAVIMKDGEFVANRL